MFDSGDDVMRRALLWLSGFLCMALGLALAPATAATYPPPHAELPSDDQPVRNVPTTGYTLSLSWAPEFCHSRRGDASGSPECVDRRTRSGFNLHGLWPDGDGPNRWPQYCHPVAILTDGEIAAGIGSTPSPQLLQHEWSKHGSCMAADPASYFAEEGRLYRSIRIPDMAGLSRRRDLTASSFAQSFADANPGMRANMLRLNVNRRGWLEEVWICLGLDKRPRPCPASAGGARPGEPVRVQGPR
jgi:ribonuclease T2